MNFNFNAFDSYYQDFTNLLPNLIKGVLFVIIAWLLFKILVYLFNRLIKMLKTDRLDAKINDSELLRGSTVKINTHKILINSFKFLLVLFIIIFGADMLNLTMVSELVSNLIEYLPKFFIAVAIFVGGAYLASQVKRMIYNLLKSFDANGSKAVSSLVFYLIFIFVSITALNQAGVNTEIISNNISFILGALLITITIAVGLGSRDVVYRLILGFYTKKNLEVGMKIQVGKRIGTIESIDNICLVLRTENEKVMIPIKKINNSEVRILS